MIDPPIPSPGSPEARPHGCKCDPAKNKKGKGAYTDQKGRVHFIVHPSCRVHETKETKTDA